MSGTGISILGVYEQWADSYPPVPHNPLMRLEQAIMTSQLPCVEKKDVLDLGCGSGRYAELLHDAGARSVVALDFSNAMLRQAKVALRVQADLSGLPFRPASFDIVISGLAIGHSTDLDACIAGIARVLKPGGTLLYSDFHPLALKEGLNRSCNLRGSTCVLPDNGYELADHFRAHDAANMKIDSLSEPRIGIELRERFKGSDDFYRRWHGVPLLFVVKARR